MATTGARPVEAHRLARLEAVLFLAREPLSSRKLSQYANLADGTEARTLVTHLNRRLDETGRAFRVEQVAGGYQLATRPRFAEWLRRLSHVPGAVTLTAPAMETLAVVAYCQPIARSQIEAIRGVGCTDLLNQLLQRDLIRIGGRAEELGRPYLYQTTRRFLQLFGLRTLDDLPRSNAGYHELAPQPPLPEVPGVGQNSVELDRATTRDEGSNQEESMVTQNDQELEMRGLSSLGAVLASDRCQARAKKKEIEEEEIEEEDDDEFFEDDDDFEDDEDDDDFEDEEDDDEDFEDDEEEEFEDDDLEDDDDDEDEDEDEVEDEEEEEWQEVEATEEEDEEDDDEDDEDDEEWEDEDDDWDDEDEDDWE